MRPPSVINPGENARESWKGVFSMYSALEAASGRASVAAASKVRITGFSLNESVLGGDEPLEALVGTEPDRRHHGIQRARGERIEEGERDGHDIDRERDPALEVAPQRLGERRVAAM